jgi:hypothetical protein
MPKVGAKSPNPLVLPYMETEKKPKKKIPQGFFLCIGVALGTSLGMLLKNLAIGVALGISIGVALDAANYKKNKEK